MGQAPGARSLLRPRSPRRRWQRRLGTPSGTTGPASTGTARQRRASGRTSSAGTARRSGAPATTSCGGFSPAHAPRAQRVRVVPLRSAQRVPVETGAPSRRRHLRFLETKTVRFTSVGAGACISTTLRWLYPAHAARQRSARHGRRPGADVPPGVPGRRRHLRSFEFSPDGGAIPTPCRGDCSSGRSGHDGSGPGCPPARVPVEPMSPEARGRRAAFGDFQTPPGLARAVARLVRRLVPRPATIIEPTCGSGAFVVAAAREFPVAGRVVGADIHTGRVATLPGGGPRGGVGGPGGASDRRFLPAGLVPGPCCAAGPGADDREPALGDHLGPRPPRSARTPREERRSPVCGDSRPSPAGATSTSPSPCSSPSWAGSTAGPAPWRRSSRNPRPARS